MVGSAVVEMERELVRCNVWLRVRIKFGRCATFCATHGRSPGFLRSRCQLPLTPAANITDTSSLAYRVHADDTQP